MAVILEESIFNKYNKYMYDIADLFNCIISTEDGFKRPQKCYAMLKRAEAIYAYGVMHVLCRDLDALTSYREAQSVNRWIQSGKGFHAIHDNSAHGGLMGGMIGINTEAFRNTFQEYDTFEKLIEGYDLSQHGSDQDLLNKRILPKIKNDLLIDKFPKQDRSNPLWESDLCSFFIGAAGCNEMETLRFFDRFDYDEKYIEFEKKHSNICYWRR